MLRHMVTYRADLISLLPKFCPTVSHQQLLMHVKCSHTGTSVYASRGRPPAYYAGAPILHPYCNHTDTPLNTLFGVGPKPGTGRGLRPAAISREFVDVNAISFDTRGMRKRIPLTRNLNKGVRLCISSDTACRTAQGTLSTSDARQFVERYGNRSA